MKSLDTIAKKQGRTLDLSSGANSYKVKRIHRPRESNGMPKVPR